MASAARPAPSPVSDSIASALRTLRAEQEGIAALAAALESGLGDTFRAVVARLFGAHGRVIVAGIGKSGHVGRKIAATLASTGTPALFVHAAEASHGDLGMILAEDVVLALSWSGETPELAALIDFTTRFGVTLVAMTSVANSALARAADHVLLLPKAPEACPNGLAPTTSSTMQMAMGDALAVALLEARGFSARDFRAFHPGGKLGAQLRLVRDVMVTGDAVPVVAPDTDLADAVEVITQKGFGAVLVVSGERIDGILTDGDVRRALRRRITGGPVARAMTEAPLTIGPDALAADAMETMNARKITVLAVAEDGYLLGLVHMHDLLRAGVA